MHFRANHCVGLLACACCAIVNGPSKFVEEFEGRHVISRIHCLHVLYMSMQEPTTLHGLKSNAICIVSLRMCRVLACSHFCAWPVVFQSKLQPRECTVIASNPPNALRACSIKTLFPSHCIPLYICSLHFRQQVSLVRRMHFCSDKRNHKMHSCCHRAQRFPRKRLRFQCCR